MNSQSPITTHVLDTATGQPAAKVGVALLRQNASGTWEELSKGETNADGRITDLLSAGALSPGRYRLTFASGEYHQRRGVAAFHPEVTIDFQVSEALEHYHVPLLLSPFGYTTYRGS